MGGALAGTHATGTPVVDPAYAALVAGLVTLTASRANRETQLILGVLAAALSRGWVLVPGVGALALAFGSIWAKHRRRRLGALTGAVAVQALLRWPPIGFQGLTVLVGMVAVLPVAVCAYRRLDPRARRRTVWIAVSVAVGSVALAAPLVIGAVMSRRAVTRGVAAA